MLRPGLATGSALVVAIALLTPAPAGSASDFRTLVTQDGDLIVTGRPLTTPGPGVTVPDLGPASPFPSVSDSVDGRGGTVTDVNVIVQLVDHARPADLDVLLVGPDGHQATLMSDVGGTTPAEDVILTLDDEADFSLPESGGFTGGAYRATNYGAVDTYPAPAPASTGSTVLSVFDGSPVQGTWRLYAVDDTGGVSGSIAGWRVVIERKPGPYPSTLVVGDDIGLVTDLDVHVSGLVTDDKRPVDLMLVGPQGQRTTVLSDVGTPVSSAPVDLVLDDEAAGPVSDVAMESGRFRPTNLGASDFFPEPAPPDNGTADLSVFDGTDPRGTWQLWAAANGDRSARIDGWSLDIAWTDAVAPVGTITVAGGRAVVAEPTVTVDLTATNPEPGTPVTRMRFSDDGVTWSPYQPYAPSSAWTLAGADGPTTVYAQLEDGAGNASAVVSDSVRLDILGPRAGRVRPAAGSQRVRRGVTVVVSVAEDLLAASVTRSTVTLVRRGSPGKVRAKVRYDPIGLRIVVDPRRRLVADAMYRVRVSTRVVDLVGHPWDQSPGRAGAQPLTWTFRTR